MLHHRDFVNTFSFLLNLVHPKITLYNIIVNIILIFRSKLFQNNYFMFNYLPKQCTNL